MPSYQFNQFTGRLKNSTNLQPLYPISPVPLERGDPPKMIWDSVKTVPAKVESSKLVRFASSLDPRLAANMKKFQPPGYMEKPVFLMGGTKDKVLFGVTLAMTGVGIAGVLEFIYGAMWEK